MPRKTIYLPASLILAASVTATSADESSGGNFKITQSVVSAGGGLSTGGSFSATGTIGQSEADESASGGAFRLAPGFWSALPNELIFEDTFEEQG